MKTSRLFILVACIALLVACKEPLIDASSSEAMIKSYNKILSSLPNEEKKQFSHAYKSIVATYLIHNAFTEKGDTRDIKLKRLKIKIDGMNSAQILEEYKKVNKKRGLSAIQRLKERIENIKNKNKQLSLVTIDEYKLYMGKKGKLNRIFMDMRIHNGSKYKITYLTFLIKIGSSNSETSLPQEGRTVYVPIPEGLEKGKKNISKKIDLGFPNHYLPKNPILSEYATTGLTGNDVSLNYNISPTLSNYEKKLELIKSKFEKEFGTE